MAERQRRTQRRAEAYRHDEEALLRPEIGTQAQFRKKKKPRAYRYDSSLSPALDWDGQNSARELGEWLLAQVEEASALDPPHVFPEPRMFGDVEISGLCDAVERLKALSRPFLDWAGKAERLSFDVPTLPLFVHERLSTKAILKTLRGHERDRQMEMQLFADPQLSLSQQLEAYEHKGGWVNRLVLGDSLTVMNSLLEYEGLGGQVQMIYLDPPYGVKFGSNFQPFVRRRDVRDGDDRHMTREPEMVKAYRDTWELGLHSYLSYLRDRLLIARELLTSSGSVFLQISDENLHHVRELLDDVFGEDNFVSLIAFAKTSALTGKLLPRSTDYLLWYARSVKDMKYRQLFLERPPIEDPTERYICVETPDGDVIDLTFAQKVGNKQIPEGRFLKLSDPSSQDPTESLRFEVEFNGRRFTPSARRHWATHKQGMDRLIGEDRMHVQGNRLWFKRYHSDFGFRPLTDVWLDVKANAFGDPRFYVVQTATAAVQRCVLMTTDPGDVVLDPTCGSGTTALVAEQWGRRWITIDTSRVPLALARQRLLTATFPYYELQDPDRGPASGFVYRRKQNAKNEEVGGIVPRVTLKSIANDEPPADEVLVDRPDVDSKITRVTGPFCVEATIPTPLESREDQAAGDGGPAGDGSFFGRMLEALRRNPVLQLGGNRTIALKNVRPPAKALVLSAEAVLEPDDAPVAIMFGPENGAINERSVYEAVREAHLRSYTQLLVIGFAIEPGAREFVDKADLQVGIPATYVQATLDLVMGDLLKTMRSSQIFSVAGLPDVEVRALPPEEPSGPARYEAKLLGLDVFDPVEMVAEHCDGGDVPAWLLDTDYNGMVFHVSQAFFPRTAAWDSLKRALGGELEDTVWDHLAGTVSAPFTKGTNDEIAVKVIDDRGNELLVVKKLSDVA